MSEIGVIGQMYEDRRTKKKGKLVERDDKYKTLLMESADGKSFNVSFGGFKSNWRKCGESEPTMEEALAEVEIPVTVIEEEKKQKRKPYKEQQMHEGYEAVTLQLMDYSKSFDNVRVSTGVVPKKRNTIVKVDNRRMFIVTYMLRNDNYMVCVNDDLFALVRGKKYLIDTKYHETWQCLRYSFFVERENLDEFLEDARQYIIDFMCK